MRKGLPMHSLLSVCVCVSIYIYVYYVYIYICFYTPIHTQDCSCDHNLGYVMG